VVRWMRSALAAAWGICAACVATAQHAVKLESETAVLEQPLAVALHLRPGDATQSEMPVACVQVDLRYGEFEVPPGQIHVSTQPVPGSGHVRIAISSALLVNEPLVHLRLTVTCEPRLQQQWTLFADPAPPPGPPRTAMPDGQWLDSAAGIAALADGGRAAADPVSGIGSAPHAVAPRTARTTAGAQPAATRTRAGRATARPASARIHSAPAARLQLGPAPEPAEVERLVQAVLAVLQRHQATAPPAGRPDPLHGELRQLRLEYEQLQATTAALRTQVERLQQPAVAPAAAHWTLSAGWVAREMFPWMALPLLVALLLWMLLRLNRSGGDALEGVDLDRFRPAAPRRAAGPPPQRRHARNPQHAAQHHPPAPAAKARSSTPPVAPVLPPGSLALPHAPADTLSTATVEHTLPTDMRQQLEQLVHAGDLDSAMILLEFHLSQESGKSAPMLLALLDIYHLRREAAEAARVTRQLNSLFNVRSPAAGPDDGSGLEAHPATLRGIVAQWDGPHAREVLKNLMLRPTAIEELQLSAFRDVLALYELAGLRDGLRDGEPPVRHAGDGAPGHPDDGMPDGALDTAPAHAGEPAPW
jgi:hypothetical protein